MTVKMKNGKELLIMLTILVGITVNISVLIRSFYIDHIGITLINISLILSIGLITASLFHISCELPTLIEEQWLQNKQDTIKGG
jgi:hypothetical protein